MPQPTRDPLLDGLVAGREAAYAALYDQFAARLLRTAHGLTGRHADAEDAVQDVFVALVQTRRSLAEVQNLPAYLFAALYRAAARRRERRRAEQRASADAASFAQRTVDAVAERDDRLERALDALPAEQREVLALKVDGGLTFEEVGAVLKISLHTAASRYRYALEKLRSALQETPRE